MNRNQIKQISDFLFEIPADASPGMKVPARIYASEKLIREMDNAVFTQIINVTTLPGITGPALCMPDAHSGYGFPIGGVAAIDPDTGIISPGGIGFDINCGVRLVSTTLTYGEVKPQIKELVDTLFRSIPAGVGSGGIVKLTESQFDEAMVKGAKWAIDHGFGVPADCEFTEENGMIRGADPASVSSRARERGAGQIGSLGSGNHYLEIQVARKGNITDPATASVFGINKDDQVMIMIHTGSRGFGHQVATDYLQLFASQQKRFGYSLPDRELACAPFYSKEGKDYFAAMNCAINIAFLNRQLILHRTREILHEMFGKTPGLQVNNVYDVCHNTAKLESHTVNGKEKRLLIHRKGATRAFPPGSPDIPEKYRSIGQPVLVGGSMESGSCVMCGTESGAAAFYTTVHGSGRTMSRHEAKKHFNGRELQKSMESHGILIRTASFAGLAEEAGGAYKNLGEVVHSAEKAGLGKVVAKLEPVGNIKG
ncbi:MAG TPA: RtcB family protein [Spirochaetota bacterium]|nr:RtcB family protein [Spirochaetota bacterium]